MGEVLLARRRGAHGFEKLVAVKTIRRDLTHREDVRAMFLDEARLAARLQHPAIVHVYDFGEAEEVLYLAMEYVQGTPLHVLLREQGPLPPAIAARIVAETCRGLHSAHELRDLAGNPLGVVHRDISPHNLILSFEGRVKILDFGIALVRDREAPTTEVGAIKGKLSYLAPEQLFSGRTLDRRTDVYASAVVLYELLTGEKVFRPVSIVEAKLMIEEHRPPAPSSLIGALPPKLDAIILRGLEKDPERRFESARAMADALDEVVAELGGESLEAYAERVLAGDREEHRLRLLRILGEEPAPPKGRTEATAPGDPAPEAPIEPTQVPSQAVAPTLIRDRAPIEPTVTPAPRRAGPWLAIVATAAVAAGAWVLLRPAPPPATLAEPIADLASASTTAHAPPAEPEPAAPPPPPPPPPEPAAEPKDAGVRRAPPKAKVAEVAAPAAVGSAKLSFGAKPYALIFLDGKPLGATPLLDVEVSAGPHHVKLISPDTEAVRYEQRFSLAEGEHKRIMLRP
jgi:serine/threonine-protein kinase